MKVSGGEAVISARLFYRSETSGREPLGRKFAEVESHLNSDIKKTKDLGTVKSEKFPRPNASKEKASTLSGGCFLKVINTCRWSSCCP